MRKFNEDKLRTIIRKSIISELSRIEPGIVRTSTKNWALYVGFYEKVFKKIDDRNALKKIYNDLLKKSDNPRTKDALTFFYRIRRDELDGAFSFN
jgi:hypothetical protein